MTETPTPADIAALHPEQTFTQADVDRIVKDRLTKHARNSFPDYDDLKASAENAATLEDRLAAAQNRLTEMEHTELLNRISLEHRLPPEDRVLLTGLDEATLTAQAARLAELTAAVRVSGNVARKEGGVVQTHRSDEETRDFVSDLFNQPFDPGV